MFMRTAYLYFPFLTMLLILSCANKTIYKVGDVLFIIEWNFEWYTLISLFIIQLSGDIKIIVVRWIKKNQRVYVKNFVC